MNLREPRTQIILVGFLIVVAAGYFYYDHSVSPKLSDIEEKRKELAKLENVLKVTKGRLKSEEEIKKWYSSMQAVDKKLNVLLPPKEKITELLNIISRAEERAGVYIESFKPVLSQKKDFYSENHYQVKLKGTYHDVGNFLAYIANVDRILTVSNIRMNAGKSSDGSEAFISVDLTLTSYNRDFELAGK